MIETIKTRLKEEIKNSGLTTVEIAKRVGISPEMVTQIAKRVGISPEMVTQYVTTKKLPKLDTFARLCKELDVSADYILGLSDE